MLHRLRHPVALTAALSIALHALGLLFALLGMGPGTGLVPLEQRLAYLAGSPALWAAGWATWMLCALVLIAFLWFLHVETGAGLILLATVLTAAGAAVDMACDTLFITTLPLIAARTTTDPTLFLAVERALGAGGMVIGNGLYSGAILLTTWALRGDAKLFRGTTALGVATFLFGMVMVGAGFAGSPLLLELCTGPTIGCFMGWTVAIALRFGGAGS